jgi:hypothetical protein
MCKLNVWYKFLQLKPPVKVNFSFVEDHDFSEGLSGKANPSTQGRIQEDSDLQDLTWFIIGSKVQRKHAGTQSTRPALPFVSLLKKLKFRRSNCMNHGQIWNSFLALFGVGNLMQHYILFWYMQEKSKYIRFRRWLVRGKSLQNYEGGKPITKSQNPAGDEIYPEGEATFK